MGDTPEYDIFRNALWQTISVVKSDQGYAVFEAPDRFWRERMAEAVLRVAGVGLILVGYFQWFLPDWALHGNPWLAPMALSALFMGTGIALYLFASRGFRKELRFEPGARQISIGRLNGNDHCLISRQIPMQRIESLFIQRATPQHPLASLCLRLKGFARTVRVMHGAPSEIEDLHRQLSRDIHLALSVPEPGAVRNRRSRKSSASHRPAPVFRAAKPAKHLHAFRDDAAAQSAAGPAPAKVRVRRWGWHLSPSP